MTNVIIAAAIVALIVLAYVAWTRRYSFDSSVTILREGVATDSTSARFAGEVKQRYDELTAAVPWQYLPNRQRWELACDQITRRWYSYGWTVPGAGCDERLAGVTL